ncbi:hypothetical protein ACP275_09G056000 [Erythranthe tilingii]
MWRKRLEIKRIKENSARMICFSKRRNGLIKKARELSVLCDVDVAAIFFSKRAKLYEYCSTDRMAQVLQQYQSRVESEKNVCDTETKLMTDARSSLEEKEKMLEEEKKHLNEIVEGNICAKKEKVVIDLNIAADG